jgi:hypothetical protein
MISKKIALKSDLDSPKKNLHETLTNCQSGKENLIIQ